MKIREQEFFESKIIKNKIWKLIEGLQGKLEENFLGKNREVRGEKIRKLCLIQEV